VGVLAISDRKTVAARGRGRHRFVLDALDGRRVGYRPMTKRIAVVLVLLGLLLIGSGTSRFRTRRVLR
jgi:hypothetical protein